MQRNPPLFPTWYSSVLRDSSSRRQTCYIVGQNPLGSTESFCVDRDNQLLLCFPSGRQMPHIFSNVSESRITQSYHWSQDKSGDPCFLLFVFLATCDLWPWTHLFRSWWQRAIFPINPAEFGQTAPFRLVMWLLCMQWYKVERKNTHINRQTCKCTYIAASLNLRSKENTARTTTHLSVWYRDN